mmetsp:Transcript_373/g.1261  ORF Transcript_373/g.1261 Transcript_373/m.1261 type:complete len:171 (+) Transcript_373:39-551(+)
MPRRPLWTMTNSNFKDIEGVVAALYPSAVEYEITEYVESEREKKNFVTTHVSRSKYWIDRDARRLLQAVEVDDTCEGPLGYVHGGFSSALLDQHMGRASLIFNGFCVTGRLEIDFRKPLKLKQALLLDGWIQENHERKLIMHANILDADKNVCVEASGIFVKVKPDAGFK